MINNNKINRNNYNTSHKTSTKSKKNSCKRKILKQNSTAALADDCGYDLAEKLVYHANRRVDLFFLECVLRKDSAKTGIGDEVIDFRTSIGPTKFQALTSEKEKHHASHSNTGAVYDNLALKLVKYVIENRVINPQLQHQLSNFGFDEEDIKLMLDPNTNKETHKELINRARARRSYVARTRLEDNLNLTVPLPRDSNLIIDKAIENYVRENFLPQTIKEVMEGKITPIVATQKYIEVIKLIFTNLETSVTSFEQKFADLKERINICIKIEKEAKQDGSDSLQEYRSQVEEIKKLLVTLKDSSNDLIKLGLPNLKRTLQSLTPRKTKNPMPLDKFNERTLTLWRKNVGFNFKPNLLPISYPRF